MIVNCLFSGNVLKGGNGGGAIGIEDSPSPTLRNCSFSNNDASLGMHGGGGILIWNSNPVISNAVLWGNLDASGQTEAAQVKMSVLASPLINFSCIQGLTGLLGGIGNLGGNPLFIDALGPDLVAGTEDDNLRPQSNSPVIDSGDNSVVPCSVSADLDGGPRIINTVEMGAYEVQSLPPGS